MREDAPMANPSPSPSESPAIVETPTEERDPVPSGLKGTSAGTALPHQAISNPWRIVCRCGDVCYRWALRIFARTRGQEHYVHSFAELVRHAREPMEVWHGVVQTAYVMTGAERVELRRTSVPGQTRMPELLYQWPRRSAMYDVKTPEIDSALGRPEPLRMPIEFAGHRRAELVLYGGYRLSNWAVPLVRRMSSLCVMAAAADQALSLSSGLDPYTTYDPVSGLHTAAFFDGVLLHALAQSRRRSEPLSILVIDVSYLHDLRRRYGDEIADAALQRIGRGVLQALRSSDVIAKISSVRIAALLVGANAKGAEIAADSVFCAVSEATMATAATRGVATRIGIASYPEGPDSGDELLRDAASKLRTEPFRPNDPHQTSRGQRGSSIAPIIDRDHDTALIVK